jgi:hypothetical protein
VTLTGLRIKSTLKFCVQQASITMKIARFIKFV